MLGTGLNYKPQGKELISKMTDVKNKRRNKLSAA